MANNIFSPVETAYPIDNAHVNSLDAYQTQYAESIQDPEAFWATVAERLTWYQKWHTVSDYDFVSAEIKWFEGGTLNACYNCLDRHVEAGHGDATAIIWEGNDPSEDKTFSFSELLAEVKKFANVLKAQGVEKAIASVSIYRWSRSWRLRCWRVPGLVLSIPSFSVLFQRNPSETGLTTRRVKCS